MFSALGGRPVAYHGVLYGPAPADHPAARTLYNRQVVSLLRARLTPGGILLVHIACRGLNAAPALAVARTVGDVMGPTVAAVRVSDTGDIEMLIVARKDGSGAWQAPILDLLGAWFSDSATLIDSTDVSALTDMVPSIATGFGGRVQGVLSTGSPEAVAEHRVVVRDVEQLELVPFAHDRPTLGGWLPLTLFMSGRARKCHLMVLPQPGVV